MYTCTGTKKKLKHPRILHHVNCRGRRDNSCILGNSPSAIPQTVDVGSIKNVPPTFPRVFQTTPYDRLFSATAWLVVDVYRWPGLITAQSLSPTRNDEWSTIRASWSCDRTPKSGTFRSETYSQKIRASTVVPSTPAPSRAKSSCSTSKVLSRFFYYIVQIRDRRFVGVLYNAKRKQ